MQKALPAAAIALFHVPPLTLFWTGTTAADWVAFSAFYLVTIFALGGALHRYFAHRAFRTSRWMQMVLGVLASSVFGDPIGFSGKHRLHHRHSDTDQDVHSPRQGWWFCWIGSLIDEGYTESEITAQVPDLLRYPELRWLHRYYFIPPLMVGALFYAAGGYTMFATAYCMNLLVAVHCPSAVNYFCHRGRSRRYETDDRSSNSLLLGILLLGEGWHNNHHYYPAAARSGFGAREPDAIYWVLSGMEYLGLIRDLKPVPERVLREGGLMPCGCGSPDAVLTGAGGAE